MQMTGLSRELTAVTVAMLLCATGYGKDSGSGRRGPASRAGVDCGAISSTFSDELGKRFDAGEPVTMTALQEMLEETKVCRFKTVRPSRRTLDARKLYERCRESVVIVGKIYNCGKCEKWHTSIASGFVIGRQGVIVTNYHVIEDDKKGQAVAVRTWDGRMLTIESLLASNKQNDLAVLKVDADDLVPLPIAEHTAVGSPVYCISHPVNQFYTMTEGILAGDFQREKGRREVAVTCDYAKGSSGGPILDETGAVAAIVRVTNPVYYTKTNGVPSLLQMVWKYGIPSSALLDLLEGESAR
jgi:serine protease Do